MFVLVGFRLQRALLYILDDSQARLKLRTRNVRRNYLKNLCLKINKLKGLKIKCVTLRSQLMDQNNPIIHHQSLKSSLKKLLIAIVVTP